AERRPCRRGRRRPPPTGHDRAPTAPAPNPARAARTPRSPRSGPRLRTRRCAGSASWAPVSALRRRSSWTSVRGPGEHLAVLTGHRVFAGHGVAITDVACRQPAGRGAVEEPAHHAVV